MKTVITMKPTGGTCHFYVWETDYEAFRLWCDDNGYVIIRADESTVEDIVFRAFTKERKNRFKKKMDKGLTNQPLYDIIITERKRGNK